MRIKICGIRNIKDAVVAVQAGANAVGVLVGITRHIAEDKISNEEAKKIIKQLPPFVSSVMVTHLTDKMEIIELAEYLNVNSIQIHDYIDPSDVLFVRKKLPSCKIIKAVHIIQEQESIDMMRSFENVCDALLLDSRTKDRLGGTGIVHDWNISSQIVALARIPVILAGGLTDNNVYEAVKKTLPFAVDVNSGVEIAGRKDYHKVKKFVTEALRAEKEEPAIAGWNPRITR